MTSVQLRSSQIIWYLLILPDMFWDHLNLHEITSDLLISKKITSDLPSLTHNTWDTLRSPGITRCCRRSLEISCDHLISREITAVQLRSPQIIWYLMILPDRLDITWGHLRSSEITENIHRFLQCSSKYLGEPEITWDHPTFSQITWNQLRSPEIT